MTDRLLKDQEKTAEVVEGDKFIRATVVTPVRVSVDEVSLRDVLTDAEWAQVTEPKFVRSKFEEFLDTDMHELRRNQLLDCISEKPSKPHVRYTAGEVKADEEQDESH